MKTNVLIGIFAHPDDEAFGPSGTLLKLAREGYDIHLILLTDGEAGSNPDGVSNLGETRLNEWREAGKLLGVKSATPLHFPDGSLQNTPLATVSEAVAIELQKIYLQYDSAVVSIMTFEPHGLTGHHDHIVATTAAERAFSELDAELLRGKLWYFCLNSQQAPLEDTPYYVPQARADDYITDRVDVSEYLEAKHQVIGCHVSQRNDAEALKKLGDQLATECFHVVSTIVPES